MPSENQQLPPPDPAPVKRSKGHPLRLQLIADYGDYGLFTGLWFLFIGYSGLIHRSLCLRGASVRLIHCGQELLSVIGVLILTITVVALSLTFWRQREKP